jgi:hypothetical protein
MSYADTAKRKLELRRKLGDRAIQQIQSSEEKLMRAAEACNDILWRVRFMRHSAGMLK